MTNVPIIKIILAVIAILFKHYKTIIAISILPVLLSAPLILLAVDILPQINSVEDLQDLGIGFYAVLYALLFLYAILSLNINLYRLATLGADAVFNFGLVPIKIVLRLLPFYALIESLVLLASVSNLPLEPVVFIVLAHVLLRFVAIATNRPTVSNLTFIDRLNITILQFIIPVLILAVVSLITTSWPIIVFKIFTVYFSALTLGLTFNNINKSSS